MTDFSLVSVEALMMAVVGDDNDEDCVEVETRTGGLKVLVTGSDVG